MRTYFASDGEYQRVFVLYGLGGAGKSQLAFKFIDESLKAKRYCVVNDTTICYLLIGPFPASPMYSILTPQASRHFEQISRLLSQEMPSDP